MQTEESSRTVNGEQSPGRLANSYSHLASMDFLGPDKKKTAQAVDRINQESWLDPYLQPFYDAAKWLHKTRAAYYPYALLDGLSLSYSMLKYTFNMLNINSDVVLHNFMAKPWGITTIVAESLFLMGFSFLACYFDDESDTALKRWIANAWPYVRDVLKAAKNSYKGLKSTFKIAQMLGAQNLSSFLIPVSLIIGVIGALNRVVLRSIRSERKDLQTKNTNLKAEIQAAIDAAQNGKALSLEQLSAFQTSLHYHSLSKQRSAMALSALGAAIDSLYLFAGIITLAPVAASILWPLAIISLIYSVALLVTRLYEEHLYQQKFLKSALDCELLILKQKLKLSLAEQANDKDKILGLVKQIKDKHQDISKLVESNYSLALLNGMRHGLYAYSAIACGLFLAASLMFVLGTPFPPILMILGAVSGLVAIAAFTLYHLICEYNKQQQALVLTSETQQQPSLDDLEKQIHETENLPTIQEFEITLDEMELTLVRDATYQFFIQEWFEVIRSFFSGFSKGQRTVDFTMNPLQELGDDGDYRDTKWMFVFMAISCPVLGLTWGLRALGRGFNKAGADRKEEGVETELEEVLESPPDRKKAEPHAHDEAELPEVKSETVLESPPDREKAESLAHDEAEPPEVKSEAAASSSSSSSNTPSFFRLPADGITKASPSRTPPPYKSPSKSSKASSSHSMSSVSHRSASASSKMRMFSPGKTKLSPADKYTQMKKETCGYQSS